LMAIMAQGKVIRLTPVTFEFKDEDFYEYQVLSYYFELVQNYPNFISPTQKSIWLSHIPSQMASEVH
jgi:hypothetical protein